MVNTDPAWLVPTVACLLCIATGCDARDTTAEAARPLPATTGVRVLVSNERGESISLIDGATNAVAATIPVGKRPRGLSVTRDGRRLYVALSGSPIAGPNVEPGSLPPADKSADGIGVVDLTSGTFVEKIVCGSDPETFSLSSDERFLYASNEDESKATIVDLVEKRIVATLPVGWEPEGVTTSPDGSLVFVTCETDSLLSIIDTAKRAVVGQIKTAERPRAVAFTPDGRKAYVTCESAGTIDVVDVAARRVIKQIKPEGKNCRPMGIVLSPDGGGRAYVTTGRGQTVVAIDTSSDAILGIVTDVGTRPWGIAITPDARTLYTANGPSNDVTVIDAQTLTVRQRIPAGESPWGVVVAP